MAGGDEEKSQQLLQFAPVLLDALAVTLHAAASQRPQLVVLELPVESGDLVAQLLQRVLQAAAPLAQARLWFGEHERYSFDGRKIDLAGLAVQPLFVLLERRQVATRAREEGGELGHGGIMHTPGSVGYSATKKTAS